MYVIILRQKLQLRAINSLRPRQMDAISQTPFSNAFSWMKMFEFRLKFHWSFFPRVQLNNIPAMVQIMAWRRPDDKPLYEPMMVNLPTHICVARPQWVKTLRMMMIPQGRYCIYHKIPTRFCCFIWGGVYHQLLGDSYETIALMNKTYRIRFAYGIVFSFVFIMIININV